MRGSAWPGLQKHVSLVSKVSCVLAAVPSSLHAIVLLSQLSSVSQGQPTEYKCLLACHPFKLRGLLCDVAALCMWRSNGLCTSTLPARKPITCPAYVTKVCPRSPLTDTLDRPSPPLNCCLDIKGHRKNGLNGGQHRW